MPARALLSMGLRILVVLVATVAAVVQLPAQGGCADPQVFGNVYASKDRLVTFTDGYKTRMDIYFPLASPGPCGWPTVLFVHSNRGSRQSIGPAAELFASYGYCTIAFDLRGQGPSMAMNNPAVYGRGALGIRERLDMAEAIEAAEAFFPGKIDMDRLGVTGPTQGGHYGWAAAAHSGRAMPPNPWRSAPMPTFQAVAVHDFDIDAWEWLVPGGTNISEMFVFNVLQDSPSLTVDPAFRAAAMPLVLAEDYAALRALVDPPELHIPTLLRTSTVPILATLSYDDMFGAATRTAEEWSAVVPGADKVLNLTTGGHQSPTNFRERMLRAYRERLWFDYHLKGIGDPLQLLQAQRYAVVPATLAACFDPQSLWDAWEGPTAPEQVATPKRFYFTAGGGLHPGPSGVGQGADVLDSTNLTGYTVADYINDGATPEEVMQEIPLRAVVYTGPVLTEDEQMVGTPRVHLPLYSDDADFLVQVALMDVAADGSERYVTGGFRTVRGHPGGALTLEFPLAVYGYRLLTGHRMRVRVENHAWHRPPMEVNAGGVVPTFLRGLPVFSDFRVEVRRGSGSKPWIEIPVVATEPLRLATAAPTVDGDAPEDLRIAIHSDSSRAGWRFQVFPSFAGPGTYMWRGYTLPIAADQLTGAVLGIPSGPPEQLMRGVLQAGGSGNAVLRLGQLNALPASAAGVTLAVLAGEPQGASLVSAPITLPVH